MQKAGNEELLNLALLSLLTGGGTYAAARGLKDLPSEGKLPAKPKTELQITLPQARLPKTAAESAMDYLTPSLSVLGGGAAGFFGASSIYEALKKKKMEKELKSVEQNYLQSLQRARTKVASIETPNVDAFVNGIFEKTAESLGFTKEAWVDPEFAGKEGIFDAALHQSKNLGNAFFDSDLGKMTLAGMIATALGSAGATYGVAKKLDNDKDNAKKQTTLPTDVRLNVA